MPYQVKVTGTAKELVSNFHPRLKSEIKAALKLIAQDPSLGKELQEEYYGFLSYRVKRYRIIYTVDDRQKWVIVHLVWHRKNVYQLLADIIQSH